MAVWHTHRRSIPPQQSRTHEVTNMATVAPANANKAAESSLRGPNRYAQWMASVGVPVHSGYYIEDARTIELGPWKERACDAAFLELAGQQGISGVYVTEIAPGLTTAPFRVAVDEMVYVLAGRGTTIIHGPTPREPKAFEWQTHSLFVIPANFSYQLTNMQGSQPVRLLHVNYLPMAMQAVPDPRFFFEHHWVDESRVYGANSYSAARAVQGGSANFIHQTWVGNFFPDMRAWDRIDPLEGRGAGGKAVFIKFPDSPMSAHMSVFPSRTYKKAHRHGPAIVIVIPAGEGYSIMWPEGREKVVIPWHEGSIFVPPYRWFHQHFNVSQSMDRYLALHPPVGLPGMGSETVEDRARDQIEYPDEDPSVRERFQAELGKRGLTSLMPDEAYKDRNFEWKY
jgi:hypothetical protein